MASVNDTLMNRGIRHAVYLEQLAAAEVDKMISWMDSKLWPDIRATLDARLRQVAATGNVGGAWRTKRYKEMLAILDGQIKGGMDSMSALAASRLTRLATMEAQWAAASLKESVPLSIAFRTPSLPTIRAIVTSRPMKGRFLKEWYSNLEGTLRRSIAEQINIGLAAGESVQTIAGRIVGIKGHEAAFTGASTHAEMRRGARAVVRTSTNHVSNAAHEATYAENSDIIKEIQWVSTLDARTSDICMALDGQRFKLGQGQRPPAHHQCRSTTVPITKSWKELGIKNAKDVRIGGRVFRDVQTGMNGVAPTRIIYPDWLKAQPAAVQNQILGAERAELFRTGRVPFPRFFSDEGGRLTLAELARLEGLPAPAIEAVAVAAPPPPPPAPPAGFDPSNIRRDAVKAHAADMERSAAAWEKLEKVSWRQQQNIAEWNENFTDYKKFKE